jgi:hypothetical protein
MGTITRVALTLLLVAAIGAYTVFFASRGLWAAQLGLAALLSCGGLVVLVRIFRRSRTR